MRHAVTMMMWVGLALYGMQASAQGDWTNWSSGNVCSISIPVRDAEDSAEVLLYWNRSPKIAPFVTITEPTWALASGGDLILRSSALPEPLTLAGPDRRSAQGSAVHALMTDIAASTDWYLVRLLPDGSERRMNPDIASGRKLAAMFGACLSIAERPLAPALIPGQRRPGFVSVVELENRCELNAHYGTRESALLLTLSREKSAASLKTSRLAPGLDLRSLGRSANEVIPWDAPVALDNGQSDRLIEELVVGRERLFGTQTSTGPGDSLVFGGPEFIVEAAMFKACVDAL